MTPTNAVALFLLVAGIAFLIEGILIMREDYLRYKALKRCFLKLDK